MKFINYLLISFSVLTIGIFTTVVQATNSTTDSLGIQANQLNGRLISKYTIKQKFDTNTKHGIFLALPLTSNGVNISYTVSSVTRDNKPEKYEIINDMLNYRFRIGDAKVTLNKGVYVYNFIVESSHQNNNQFSYPVLTDWQDPINKLEVTVNGKTQKTNNKDNSFFILTNEDKPQIPTLVQFYNKYIIAIATLVVSFLFSILGCWSIKISPLSSKYSYTGIEFAAPKKLLPWEGSYLINDGKVSLKNTLIAYYLYLHNQNYITLEDGNSSERIKFLINKELPYILPSYFNKIINQSQTSNLAQVFSNLHITEQHADSLNKHITEEVKQYYHKLPNSNPTATVFLIYAVTYILALFIWFMLIEPIFLISPIWLWLILVSILLFIPFTNKVVSSQERFTTYGLDMFRLTKGFYNYIDIAEKDKLNFDNNPTEGSKYYLDNVPWAVQFGLLKKFNVLANNLNIPQSAISNTDILSSSVTASTFYIEPSSSDASSSTFGGGFSEGGGSW